MWLGDDDIKGNENDLLGHSFAGGVVSIALNARVRRLMPIHLHPKKTAMKREGLQVTLPAEGTVYEIPGALY